VKHIPLVALLLAVNSALAIAPDIQQFLQKQFPSSIVVPGAWFSDSANVQTLSSADLDGTSVLDYVVPIAQLENGSFRISLVAIHNLHTKSEAVFTVCELPSETKIVQTGLNVLVFSAFSVLPAGTYEVVADCRGETTKLESRTFKTSLVGVHDCGERYYTFDGTKYVRGSLTCCNP
jgi:hypothetical protein